MKEGWVKDVFRNGKPMIARIIFGISVLAGVATVIVEFFVLPERVPLHFGGSGGVDRWGSRTEALVTSGALIGGLSLLFLVLAVVVPRTPESLLNIPERDKQWWLATPERRTELHRRIVSDLYLIGAATLFLIVGIEAVTIVQARETSPALGWSFWAMVSIYFVGVLGYTGYMIAVRYRAPRTA